jgi:F0F1-type ATP synthase delta subunit
MNYKKYAKILIEEEKNQKTFSDFFDNFINFLKEKGELKFLPKILVEVENLMEQENKNNKTKIILKDKSFFEKYKEEIQKYSEKFNVNNLEIEENKNIINGYILKSKKFKLDNSYKKKLLNLHKKILN